MSVETTTEIITESEISLAVIAMYASGRIARLIRAPRVLPTAIMSKGFKRLVDFLFKMMKVLSSQK